MKKEVFLVSKSSILQGIPKGFNGGDCYFLGVDYSAYRKIRKKYSDAFSTLLLGAEFHKTLDAIKNDFLSLSHQINEKNASYAYWGSNLASRNSATIPLLKHLVYYQCAKRIIEQTSPQIMFVFDSPALARLIRDMVISRGIGCRIQRSLWDLCMPLFIHLRIVARGCFFVFQSIVFGIFSRFLRNERMTMDPGKERYLLRSWVTRGSVEQSGVYHDRNFGILPEFLAKEGKEVRVLPMFFNLDRNIFSQMKIMSGSETRFVFPEQYLSFTDILKTLRDGTRNLHLNLEGCLYDGHHVKGLIDEIQQAEALSPFMLSCLSIQHLLAQFSKRKIRIDQFVYPIENNSPEKTYIQGIRRFYPRSGIVGFQHSVWFKEQLGYFLLPEELRYHPLPDKIVCSGKKYQSIIEKVGFPLKMLVSGPNLRYTQVNQDQAMKKVLGRGPKKVLIILNYEMNHNFELLDKTGKALKLLGGIKIRIKAHPTTPVQLIDDFLKDIAFPAYEWAGGSVQENVLNSDLVFMTGGSVSNLETMAKGVPLIRVSLENNFDFDCLWDKYPFAPFISSVEEIGICIQRAFRMTIEEQKKLNSFGREVVRNYFEPVTPENLKVFVASS